MVIYHKNHNPQWEKTLKLEFVGLPRSAGAFSGVFTIVPSPQGGDFTGDLLDQKSKSPLFPGGGGAVVTND